MSWPHSPSSDTSPQSPAFIKQSSLTRMSINILASRPKGIGQVLKRTFISADQKEGLEMWLGTLHLPPLYSPRSRNLQSVSRMAFAIRVAPRRDLDLKFTIERERVEREIHSLNALVSLQERVHPLAWWCACACVYMYVCVYMCMCVSALHSFTQEEDCILCNT